MTEKHWSEWSTTDLVLEAIKMFWHEKGYSPSIRDIMEATGISSTSVVHYHILKLERAGVISRTVRVARSYILIERRLAQWKINGSR